MELVYLILADAAESGSNGKIAMVGGDFDNIYVGELPTLFSRISLVVKLRFEHGERAILHPFQIRVVDPDGEVRQPEIKGSLALPSDPETAPFNVSRFIVNLPAMFLQARGTYSVVLVVNERELGRIPFQVLLKPNVESGESLGGIVSGEEGR